MCAMHRNRNRQTQSIVQFFCFVCQRFFLLPVKYKEEGRNAQKIPNNNKRVKNVLKSAFWLKVSGRTKKNNTGIFVYTMSHRLTI